MLRDDGQERISTYCTGGTCLSVSLRGSTVSISGGGHPEAATVECDRGEWAAFVAGVKNGEFDLPDT